MELSEKDRVYLSELWEWASGEKTSHSEWNDEASKLLFDMYREVTRCSRLIHIATAIPQNLPPDPWDIYNLYKSIKGLVDQHEIHKVCRDKYYLAFRRDFKGDKSSILASEIVVFHNSKNPNYNITFAFTYPNELLLKQLLTTMASENSK